MTIPYFSEDNSVVLVEWNDYIIGEKRLKDLPRPFTPSAFCRAVFKLAYGDGRNKNLFSVVNESPVHCGEQPFHGVNANICVNQIHLENLSVGKIGQHGLLSLKRRVFIHLPKTLF